MPAIVGNNHSQVPVVLFPCSVICVLGTAVICCLLFVIGLLARLQVQLLQSQGPDQTEQIDTLPIGTAIQCSEWTVKAQVLFLGWLMNQYSIFQFLPSLDLLCCCCRAILIDSVEVPR